MKISHGTRILNISDKNGYGYATRNMLSSLSRLGYEVNTNDESADVEIWFDQPLHWKFSDGPYKIGYHPWESTKLKDGWVDIMNQCDEIWTPSPIIAQWYREDGVEVPVHVYEHGVDKIWSPMRREPSDTLKFLHVGMEAARKGGNETMRAFKAAFPKADDVSLTMKTINIGWNMPPLGGIAVECGYMDLDNLVKMFHNHDVYVYPSWGEGFGLTPLQALATGMPTITVPAWAPYAKYLDENLSISSLLVQSPWRRTHHPGRMFKPKFDDIVDAMRYAYDNYDEVHTNALSRTKAIHTEYDWDLQTRTAFEKLASRLGK
jgi:hypothetical protein